jgi:hypothetical protein
VTRPLVIATFVACSSVSTATDDAERLPADGGATVVQSVTFRNKKYAFELQYPDSYDVTSRHPLDPEYEETFYFSKQSSPIMYLQVTELNKYLPKTSTPNERLYLKSRRGLKGFKSIRVDRKSGYEYRVCGRGACDLNVMFIHRSRQYVFSVNIGSEIPPPSAGFATQPADARQVIRSLRFLDE